MSLGEAVESLRLEAMPPDLRTKPQPRPLPTNGQGHEEAISSSLVGEG
jgi:hypothetical protein